MRIELLVVVARIRLAWRIRRRPSRRRAAQAWGEAFFANGEIALAQRAFTRALELCRRIEHPGASDTERWLARVV